MPNLEIVFQGQNATIQRCAISRFELPIVLKSKGNSGNKRRPHFIRMDSATLSHRNGVNMEPARPENQGPLMQSLSKVSTNLLPVVVTADVCLAIITHWKNYDWLGRFLAVVLMLNLGMALLLVFKKPREGERNRRVTYVSLAYGSLLLAPCCSIDSPKKNSFFELKTAIAC